jgi:hypothetical protein
MADQFAVDYALMCDYSAMEVTGKHTFAGAYGAEMVFGANPDVWPPMWLVVALQPIARQFEFKIQFVRPDNGVLIDFTGSYEAQAEEPPVTTRVVLPIQFHQVRFTGPGVYRIEVYEKEGRPVFKKLLHVRVGPESPPVSPPKLTGSVTFDARL